MADQPRLTKKELREQKRVERLAAEAAKKQHERKQGIQTAVISVVVLSLVGWGVWLGFGRTTVIANATIDAVAVPDAFAAADCEVIDEDVLPDRSHLDPTQAPPADALYTGLRPTHSGAHFTQVFPPSADAFTKQADERALTHNLEHGAIIAWYNPELIDPSALDTWAQGLNGNGFLQPRSGGGIFVSPYTEPGLPDGVGVALRAWGTATNCTGWNDTLASSFVIDNYGTHGFSPERSFSPYPEGALGYGDGTAELPTDEPSATDEPISSESATDEPSESESATDGG